MLELIMALALTSPVFSHNGPIPKLYTCQGKDISPRLNWSGTRQGRNDWDRTGYGGPCPPIGRHRYVHQLYALDVVLPDLKQPTKAVLLEAVEGHILEEAELMGTYQKT
jgi:phosphatidylethanolamine-binding protein (PEBP) family uncharacterized protein